MPKNKGKGGKNRRRGKNESDEKRELIFKEDGQGRWRGCLAVVGAQACATLMISQLCLCRIRPGAPHARERPPGGLLHGWRQAAVPHPRQDEEEGVGEHRRRCAGGAARLPGREGGRYSQVSSRQRQHLSSAPCSPSAGGRVGWQALGLAQQ
jgi:hypothetical protein